MELYFEHARDLVKTFRGNVTRFEIVAYLSGRFPDITASAAFEVAQELARNGEIKL